jgi:mRNA interferase MazF
MVTRGEIWLTSLDPVRGSEIAKTRPCMIVSPPEIHDRLRTVMAVPMTTRSSPAPFRVPIVFEGKRGLILLDHIRALDKSRLVRRLGQAEVKTLDAVLATLQEMFAP